MLKIARLQVWKVETCKGKTWVASKNKKFDVYFFSHVFFDLGVLFSADLYVLHLWPQQSIQVGWEGELKRAIYTVQLTPSIHLEFIRSCKSDWASHQISKTFATLKWLIIVENYQHWRTGECKQMMIESGHCAGHSRLTSWNLTLVMVSSLVEPPFLLPGARSSCL